ncbi:MAG TPA: hypothetical protein VJ353_10020, partial [Xanthobacteraceae bacterium]|nr:hypothetical protein [Xanthobacteraceae bacterium]
RWEDASLRARPQRRWSKKPFGRWMRRHSKDDAEFKPQRSQRFHCNKSTSPSLLAKPWRIDDYHRARRNAAWTIAIEYARTMRLGEG